MPERLSPVPGATVDWECIQRGALGGALMSLATVPQNPAWHGEGDVWTHTRMVCDALVGLPAWQQQPEDGRELLFWAALLHDLGKASCTRMIDGVWQSPNHALRGAQQARALLWRSLGLAGGQGTQQFRESVCALIRRHTFPLHATQQREPERRLHQLSATLAAGFTLERLCILAQADVLGRIASDTQAQLEEIALCRILAEDAGCLHQPLSFPDAYSRFAYLSGKTIQPGQPLFDPTWGEVILLSGLPGTGKDTYIRQHFASLPMVSLDRIRARLNISPAQPQGAVVAAAREEAKAYLRQKQPFVWNATDLTPMLREKQLRLFADYGASTRIVYLETAWPELLRRNAERADTVPETAIARMLEELIPPDAAEARTVEWVCV